MMPAPTYLKGWVLPNSATIDEENFSGKVICPCGCEEFQLFYPGQTQEYKDQEVPCTAVIDGKFFFLLKAKCSACGKEKTLFDADFHGWDGYVCYEPDQASIPRPDLKSWDCKSCNSLIHNVQINIETQGKQDFIDETDGEFPEDRWVDGFSWIDFDIKCKECGTETKQWVSYETM